MFDHVDEGSSSTSTINPIETVENHCPMCYKVTTRLTLLHPGILYIASLKCDFSKGLDTHKDKLISKYMFYKHV